MLVPSTNTVANGIPFLVLLSMTLPAMLPVANDEKGIKSRVMATNNRLIALKICVIKFAFFIFLKQFKNANGLPGWHLQQSEFVTEFSHWLFEKLVQNVGASNDNEPIQEIGRNRKGVCGGHKMLTNHLCYKTQVDQVHGVGYQ